MRDLPAFPHWSDYATDAYNERIAIQREANNIPDSEPTPPEIEAEARRQAEHKRPCISFDLTDPSQQRECFHFSNLQPLWAHENLSKREKWTP